MMTYRDYPPYNAYRGGCRVCWYYYHSIEDAKLASAAAKHNAKIQAALGFDFGYQAPGAMELVKDGERAGMWEVCIG
jgi:hypothetical protein